MLKPIWYVRLWLKESFHSLYRNAWRNLLIFMLTMISLLLFLVSYLVSQNATHFANVLNDKVEIRVDMKMNATSKEEKVMKQKLNALDGVKAIEYVSADDAFERMKKEMGKDSEVLELLGKNPFSSRFVIKLDHPTDVKDVASAIQGFGLAENVQYGSEYVDKLLQFTRLIKTMFYGIGIGVLVITVYMIGSFIKMNIDQKQKEIDIKYLTGASSLTVRLPFILEAILTTTASAGVVYAAYYFGYEYGMTMLTKNVPYLPLLTVNELNESVLKYVLGIGAGIGFIGSLFSTQRFLKKY